MNDDQAVVVRLAALRSYAVGRIDLASASITCSPDRAQDYLRDAKAALARVAELEREAA